jgi:superfamily II DNA or RNA helicase
VSRRHDPTFALFGDTPRRDALPASLEWPHAERFPLNLDNAQVADTVVNDLRASQDALIVTGFAALDRLIDFVADAPEQGAVRLLLGSEPFDARREQFHLDEHGFSDEVERYWLERGISLLHSAALIRCIERLRSGRACARYLAGHKRLHAKIYVGDDAATLGSSNFTRPGLQGQYEANARFSRAKEPVRYRETREIAENYWKLGRDYNAELIALLEKLLQVVGWREALARACAELLEGEWARDYLERDNLVDAEALWPAQRRGIAQALYILDKQGSVLVADATGSGKTRMGAHLIGALRDHIVRQNRLRQGTAIMISPPTVKVDWQDEAMKSSTALDVYSHGELSHAKSRGHELTVGSLRRAQILCVDEGHNFLNLGSARTQHLLRNLADHVLLFTATPINRSASDLLRIATMLGADNLEEKTFKTFRRLLGAKQLTRALSESEIALLREEINRFTVRRTKRDLNQMVDQAPGRYRDRDGKPCRYPRHDPHLYSLHESAEDLALANEIRELADQLYAVTHFVKPVEMPDVLRQQGLTKEQYLRGRLNSAKKIARYTILVSLRSSRLALAEHIVGTVKAATTFELTGFRKQNTSKGLLRTLMKLTGNVPVNKLGIPLPDWLTDPDQHAAACAHDLAIYTAIHDRVKRMSDGREKVKADLLVRLAQKHPLLLAFDRRPITLAYIHQLLKATAPKLDVLIATGESADGKRKLVEAFRHGSRRKDLIGLCSDSLSEGVNLQQASAMVHLDMPSVVRIAEQRVGRVDRMDSPHRAIEAWWPDDAGAFAISSDERFLERYETVEHLLGSNMPLPDDLLRTRGRSVSAKEMVETFEKEREVGEWDGISDAFLPVRRLAQGDIALFPKEIYDRYKGVKSRVLSRVSLVHAKSPWAFFCLSAGSFATPRWLLMPSLSGQPLHELEPIVDALRMRLDDAVEDIRMDDHSAHTLEHFIKQLNLTERTLLPRRKQRALEEMEQVLVKYAALAADRKNQALAEKYARLLDMLQRPLPDYQPNWDEVAGRWLDLVRPIWHEKLHATRSKILLLKDIRKDLIAKEDDFGPRVLDAFGQFPGQQKLDERIKACIVGVA